MRFDAGEFLKRFAEGGRIEADVVGPAGRDLARRPAAVLAAALVAAGAVFGAADAEAGQRRDRAYDRAYERGYEQEGTIALTQAATRA